MGRVRKQPEADVILGVFPQVSDNAADAVDRDGGPGAEVIRFAPFLEARRERAAATVVPPADPA